VNTCILCSKFDAKEALINLSKLHPEQEASNLQAASVIRSHKPIVVNAHVVHTARRRIEFLWPSVFDIQHVAGAEDMCLHWVYVPVESLPLDHPIPKHYIE
jgi:hypothetical protein